MNDELEKIDQIRARTGVSYREAKNALDAAGGDVIRALIDLEERDRSWEERLRHQGLEIVSQVKELFQKGQDVRIKVKHGDRTVFEVPASVGALGLAAALTSSELAVLGVLGALTAMAMKYSLEIERRDGQQNEGNVEQEQGM